MHAFAGVRATLLGISVTGVCWMAFSTCGQSRERPKYGIGAPLPEAVKDTAASIIRNELTVEFTPSVDEGRRLFLVDSIGGSLRAAVIVTESVTFTKYTFRWPPELTLQTDSLLLELKSVPEVQRVWHSIRVKAAQ